jgi:hypothetical protein
MPPQRLRRAKFIRPDLADDVKEEKLPQSLSLSLPPPPTSISKMSMVAEPLPVPQLPPPAPHKVEVVREYTKKQTILCWSKKWERRGNFFLSFSQI